MSITPFSTIKLNNNYPFCDCLFLIVVDNGNTFFLGLLVPCESSFDLSYEDFVNEV